MTRRLMGVETEYALTFFGKDGTAVPPEMEMSAWMAAARRCLVHLPDGSERGIFTSNAGRLYVDCGCHAEYATPENEDPWQLVRYVEAGDRTLLRVAEQVAGEGTMLSRCVVSRGNVDYATASTWGCHESQLHRTSPQVLLRHLVPHLVSRVIYAGAGGFDPFAPGLEFTLSARAPHMTRVVSGHSTDARGIFHTKQESLCRGFGRLHLLCGDSVRSQTALWLTAGTTALVVAMAEADLEPAEWVQIRSPLAALRTFAADPDCRARVRMASGGMARAVEIQRHLLSMARTHVRHACMPPWAEEVCTLWEAILNAIARDPFDLVGVLEWPTKLSIYTEHARRAGMPWSAIVRWNRVLRRLPREEREEDDEAPERFGAASSLARVLFGNAASALSGARRSRGREPRAEDRNAELDRFVRIRRELFETDTRWGQLGRGLFAELDASGVLRHRVDGIGDVERAVSEPPAAGRARIRGAAVRELAPSNNGRRYACGWEGVYDLAPPARYLDLADPFAAEVPWTPYAPFRVTASVESRLMSAHLERMGL